MTKDTLWRISPVRATEAVQAVKALNYNALAAVPYCRFLSNYISVVLWSCGCHPSEHVLELCGHMPKMYPNKMDKLVAAITQSKKTDGVRFFSRRLTQEQAERVRQLRM